MTGLLNPFAVPPEVRVMRFTTAVAQNGNYEIDVPPSGTSHLPNGTYSLQVDSSQGAVVEKITTNDTAPPTLATL